jgi:pyruvate,water dikinase
MLVVPFDRIRKTDAATVGGKTSSLGELRHALGPKGLQVPDGFAVTAEAYWHFLEHNELRDRIPTLLKRGRGKEIRDLILQSEIPGDLADAIRDAYRALGAGSVAVRSSATAEDLPNASFAGQQDSFLNVRGDKELLAACKKCLASLFNDRAIAYREAKGFPHDKVALTIAVQTMVRSDRGAAGVMFTVDPESGFPRVVVIEGAFGLGESVVQGTVTPDEYVVFKPLMALVSKTLGSKATKVVHAKRSTKTVRVTKSDQRRFVLEDDEVLTLTKWAMAIEDHYGRAMDIEWAKDGLTDALYIVQARPETIHTERANAALRSYHLKKRGPKLAQGAAVGQAIASGPVRRIEKARRLDEFPKGAVLVTRMTDPDWVPIMKRAAAIITEEGGRTCHAAIVARELGIPAVVGVENDLSKLVEGQTVTVSCAEGGHGLIYDGKLPFVCEELDLASIPKTRTHVMVNLASPDAAYRTWQLPSLGVGLARTEFIVSDAIQAHPMALLHPEKLDAADRKRIRELTRGWESGAAYFVDRLASGIARIASSQYPKRVIVRTSDFKTNEYAGLIGGKTFEPKEHNPMIGFRGASRYAHERYREAFELECAAFRRVRDELGLVNTHIMIPFVRTLAEADRVIELLAKHGLERGKRGLELYVMCEVPATVILARDFAERFDGFSIGSNDLTQLVLGVDRDSRLLADTFDENDEAVRWCIEATIHRVHAGGGTVGLCGQAPSDDPNFAAFLVEAGIDSISLDPDRVVPTIHHIAEVEAQLRKRRRAA